MCVWVLVEWLCVWFVYVLFRLQRWGKINVNGFSALSVLYVVSYAS